MYEFFIFLAFAWPISGLISLIAHFQLEDLKYDLENNGIIMTFVACFALGIFGLPMVYSSYQDSIRWEKDSAKRKAKSKATKERKLKNALENFPKVFDDVSKQFNEINTTNIEPSINFYKKIEEICGYCSALNSSQIRNKETLREILIFSRLNVLTFYENNNLKNSDKLAKKIATTLKKLK
jgi:hypothetical protein